MSVRLCVGVYVCANGRECLRESVRERVSV